MSVKTVVLGGSSRAHGRQDFDFIRKVQMSLIPGCRIIEAMAERESIGTTITGEDLWRGNDLTPAPTSHTRIPFPDDAGEQMSVVSEHANDNAAGVGAQTVTVHYLDAAGAEDSERFISGRLDRPDGVTTITLNKKLGRVIAEGLR